MCFVDTRVLDRLTYQTVTWKMPAEVPGFISQLMPTVPGITASGVDLL